MKFAHEVVLDLTVNEILIDGVVFPYYVTEAPEIELVQGGAMGALHLGLLANNITVVTREGQRRPVVSAPLSTELAWARARAEEIVVRDLAGVLRALPK